MGEFAQSLNLDGVLRGDSGLWSCCVYMFPGMVGLVSLTLLAYHLLSQPAALSMHAVAPDKPAKLGALRRGGLLHKVEATDVPSE